MTLGVLTFDEVALTAGALLNVVATLTVAGEVARHRPRRRQDMGRVYGQLIDQVSPSLGMPTDWLIGR